MTSAPRGILVVLMDTLEEDPSYVSKYWPGTNKQEGWRLTVSSTFVSALRRLTHCVPHVDVAFASPVIALGEGLPVGEHVAFLQVGALSEAVIVHPGSPVVHVAGVHLSVSCSEERMEGTNQNKYKWVK